MMRAIYCDIRPRKIESLPPFMERIAGAFDNVYLFVTGGMIDANEGIPWVNVVIEAARPYGIAVWPWYGPTWDTDAVTAHPEWASVKRNGKPNRSLVCLARPEAAAARLVHVERLLRECPGIAGVHLEEPGYGGNECYCPICERDARGDTPEDRSLWLCYVVTQWVAAARRLTREAGVSLSAVGNALGTLEEWRIGRDWPRCLALGLIDYAAVMAYTTDAVEFVEWSFRAKNYAGQRVHPVAGLRWSGCQENPAVALEIRLARMLGFMGITLFPGQWHDTPLWTDIRNALME